MVKHPSAMPKQALTALGQPLRVVTALFTHQPSHPVTRQLPSAEKRKLLDL
jgi:hypothetical protein